VAVLQIPKVNLYGISYGTRWALEVMRRHPGIVRSAVLDGIYPPEINGEQNEPEIVRTVFEQLYGECASDKLCRERNPDLAANVKALLTEADRDPLPLTLALEDGPQPVKLDGPKLLLVMLHMMRQGEAALVPEAVTALKHGDKRLIKQFAEDLEEDDGGLLETNAQQFGGLFNTIECRDLGWRRPGRARVGDPERRCLQPDCATQQAAGFLPGMARPGGAACRAPASDGGDPDVVAERRLRLAHAIGVGP